MKGNSLTNILLLCIAVSLAAIALKPLAEPQPAQAQVSAAYPYYFEPGTQMLRAPDGSKSVLGRVVVDMRTGRVWGFPTGGSDTYPFNATDTKPITSHPFFLGRFALEEADR
jgi:hypothetical protein